MREIRLYIQSQSVRKTKGQSATSTETFNIQGKELSMEKHIYRTHTQEDIKTKTLGKYFIVLTLYHELLHDTSINMKYKVNIQSYSLAQPAVVLHNLSCSQNWPTALEKCQKG